MELQNGHSKRSFKKCPAPPACRCCTTSLALGFLMTGIVLVGVGAVIVAFMSMEELALVAGCLMIVLGSISLIASTALFIYGSQETRKRLANELSVEKDGSNIDESKSIEGISVKRKQRQQFGAMVYNQARVDEDDPPSYDSLGTNESSQIEADTGRHRRHANNHPSLGVNQSVHKQSQNVDRNVSDTTLVRQQQQQRDLVTHGATTKHLQVSKVAKGATNGNNQQLLDGQRNLTIEQQVQKLKNLNNSMTKEVEPNRQDTTTRTHRRSEKREPSYGNNASQRYRYNPNFTPTELNKVDPAHIMTNHSQPRNQNHSVFQENDYSRESQPRISSSSFRHSEATRGYNERQMSPNTMAAGSSYSKMPAVDLSQRSTQYTVQKGGIATHSSNTTDV